ncbi:MAG TPA: ankyrin repeat domain-containing protein [Planctomycetaceae bacterium]|jgi:ankyrin repeat protein|nr:ankyrin repeat domain-containing protein [Planctomycetaceae bacterium]
MCHVAPVGRIAFLLVLIAARPCDRLSAQGPASQPAVQPSPPAPVPKAPDPCASAAARTPATRPDKPLAIKLEFAADNGKRNALNFDEVFYVSLTNMTYQPIKLWDPDSKRGWCQLSFELTDLDSGHKYIIRRTPLNDSNPQAAKETRKKPWWWTGTLQIGPHDPRDFDVLLNDCQESWRGWTGVPQTANGHRFSIVAQLESAANRSESGFWTGAIRSDSVEVRIQKGQRSPHYYLSCGFVAKAFRILKADPSWVSKRDEQYGTLLNTAISAGAKDVAKWLLEHGADVNAADKNKLTPLQRADDPEIVALILEKKPELIRGRRGRIVLQAMLYDAARSCVRNSYHSSTGNTTTGWGLFANPEEWRAQARSAERRRECRALAALYIKAGADYDLFAAIHLNDLNRVKTLMNQSPRPAVGDGWKNPLRLAASVGSVEVCRLLIEQYHFNVDDFAGGGGYPVMAHAVAHPPVVRLLIAHGANLNRRYIQQDGGSDGFLEPSHCDNPTALHYAAEYGTPGTIQLLIDKGLDVFATGKSDVETYGPPADPTPLDVAASSFMGENVTGVNVAAIVQHPKFQAGDRATRSRLLNRCLLKVASPYPNDGDFTNKRPERLIPVLQTLLQAGADPNCSENGATTLQIAACGLHLISAADAAKPDEVDSVEFNESIMKEINFLRQHGARLDLFTAASIGDEAEVARLLKQNRALANSKSFEGLPALHVAAARDFRNIVKQLLDAGCDVDIRSQGEGNFENGDTALIVAAGYQRSCIAKMLIDRGANVNVAAGKSETTPLEIARRLGDVQLEKMLLEEGAKSDSPPRQKTRESLQDKTP